jgi:hypothetical protein
MFSIVLFTEKDVSCCLQGYKYVSDKGLEECCGRCLQTHCVVDRNITQELLKVKVLLPTNYQCCTQMRKQCPSKPGVGNWRPAGRMRPASSLSVAHILTQSGQHIIKKKYIYIYIIIIIIIDRVTENSVKKDEKNS